MTYNALPQPIVPDWQDVINNRAYAQSRDAYAGGNTPGAVNALLGIGEFGKANILKQWQDASDKADTAQEAGGLAAAGNMKGAQSAFLKAGDWEGAKSAQNMNITARNQQIADASRALEKTSTLLGSLKETPTPENWERTKRAAIATGLYSPADIAKMDAQISAQGLLPTIDFYHKQILGAQGQIDELKKQHADTVGSLGQLGLQYLNDPEGWSNAAKTFSAAHGDPAWLKPYLAPEGVKQAIAEAGLGDKVFAAQNGGKGGHKLAIDMGSQKVLDQFIAEHPEWKGREGEIGGLAQSAFGNKTYLELSDDGKPRLALAPGTLSYTRSPEGVTANTRAREGSKAHVKLDTQINRLDAAKEQIQQLRDLAGAEGSPQRANFEAAIGPINQNTGKQWWGSTPEIRALVDVVKSRTSTIQDELAQYVQTGGNSSDVRARKAYEVAGNIQNTKDVPTLLIKLNELEKVMDTIKKVPRVNPLGAPGSTMRPQHMTNEEIMKVLGH
jgi:hypothetical protein